MKNFKFALGVSVIALALFLTSCSKGSSGPGSGDGGTNPPPVPQPTVSINAPAGKAWYGDSIVITYSSANSDAVIINNTKKPASGSFTVYNVTQAQNLSFQAVNSSNQTSGSVSTVSVDSYSQRETFLCKPGVNNIWRLTNVKINGLNSSGCMPLVFNINKTLQALLTECGSPVNSNGSWSINGNNIQISNINYNIISMSQSIMVLTAVNNIGQLVEETYTR